MSVKKRGPYILLFAAALARSFECLRSFLISQDDVNQALCVSHAAGTGFADFIAMTFTWGGITYEPLAHISFRLLYEAGWNVPLGYRALAIALLGLTACLVFHIAQRFLRDQRWAWAAGLFYVLHPMHNINAASVGIAHYLAALFVLLGFLLHIRGGESGRSRARIFGICSFYFLGTLSKETALLLPLFLLSFDFIDPFSQRINFFTSRRLRYEYAALAVIPILYGSLRFGWAGGGGARITFSHILPHIFEALSGWSLPLAAMLIAAALLLTKPQGPTARKSAFCAAWILLGMSLFLLLPGTHALTGRMRILPFIGAAWLLAIALDALAQRRGAALCLPAALLAATAIWLDGDRRIGCPARSTQWINIRNGLALCSPRSDGKPRSMMSCQVSALSLELAGKSDPVRYDREVDRLRDSLSARDFETMIEFHKKSPLTGDCRGWRFIAQSMAAFWSPSAVIEDLRPFLDARPSVAPRRPP